MRGRFIPTSMTGASAAAHNGILAFPVVGIETVVVDKATQPALSYWPFRVPVTGTPPADQGCEWWWRVKSFNITVTTSFDGNATSASFDLPRVKDDDTGLTDERDLPLHVPRWKATGDFSDMGHSEIYDTELVLFSTGYATSVSGPSVAPTMTPGDARYYYRTDDDTVIPSFSLAIGFLFNDGTDYTAAIRSYEITTPDPPSYTETPGSFFCGYEFETNWLELTSLVPGIVTVSISIKEWFEWKDADGNNPIWDSATGAEILSHEQD